MFWGGPRENQLTPFSTRTTNKTLNIENVMIKMMNVLIWSYHVLRSVFENFFLLHILSSLSFLFQTVCGGGRRENNSTLFLHAYAE